QWSQTTGDLELLIVNAPANSTFDVILDGNKIGEITTDGLGIGTLDLQDASLPVSNGSTLEVGDLSGQFADFSAADTLVAAMVGPNFEIGAAEFNAAQNHFNVAVIADSNTTYSVFVDVNSDGNFVHVGDITTDDLGIGSLTLDPLPAGFPTIHDGS